MASTTIELSAAPESLVGCAGSAELGFVPTEVDLDDYTRVDARIGYKFPHKDLEASLIVQNVLDDFHQEFPAGEFFQRQVLFQVNARF